MGIQCLDCVDFHDFISMAKIPFWSYRHSIFFPDGQESTSSLSTLKESGLSLSLASLYSDADLLKNQQLSERRDTFPEKTE